MQPKNLSAWLREIETLHPKAIDLTLDRVQAVAKRMQCDVFQCPVITVGGTNGKGSTVAMLEALYLEVGYKTGVYTSPHLLHFNERIRLSGCDVSDEMISHSFERIEKLRNEISLTYFEFATLAAFSIFQEANCDVIILEVGLGGRLDATNIVDANVSVLTTIAIDHVEYLGNTRERIAQEKAGILRPNHPCVCGDPHPPQNLLKYADDQNVPLRTLKKDFDYHVYEKEWSFISRVGVHEEIFNHLPLPKIELQNAATALQAALELKTALPFYPGQLCRALEKVHLIGRFQFVESKGFQHYFDVAHNPAGAAWLANRLAEEPCVGRTFAVWSMLGDKDIHASVAPLLPLVAEWFCAPLLVPRAASAQALQAALKNAKTHIYSDIEDAYYNALSIMQPDDRLLIFGSFHTVAAVMLLCLRGE